MVLTAPLDRPLTYDDLVALPDDGKRYELMGGEIYELPAPNLFHQLATGTLFSLLRDFVLLRQLGLVFAAPLDVRFDPRNIVQPDIVFLSREKRHFMRKGNFKLIEGAPDLLMEILSPSNRGHDFIKKAALYATFGVREYWIVDPEAETILVQVLRDRLFVPLVSEDGIVRSEVLPGFEVDPKGLFAIPEWMSDEANGASDAE
jgi:Uma2 family endonuclease